MTLAKLNWQKDEEAWEWLIGDYKLNVDRLCCSWRWPHGDILNSPLPTDTQSSAAWRPISSLKNLQAGWMMTTHQENMKKTTCTRQERPGHNLGINLTPAGCHTTRREIRVLRSEWRGWSHHKPPPILWPTPDRQAPQMSTFEKQQGCCPETHKNVVTWKSTLKRHTHSDSVIPGLSSEAASCAQTKMKWDYIKLKASAQRRKP